LVLGITGAGFILSDIDRVSTAFMIISAHLFHSVYHPPVSVRWISMKVTIDRATCVSCGSCWETCPGFFEQDPDDSFSRIIEKFRINGNIAEGTPPADLEACAQDAVDLCPVQIITIQE
jgi:ferredoxin